MKNNSIKNKSIIKNKAKPLIKVRRKYIFKNKYTFKINNNKKNKNLTFYYGFQK